MDALASVGRAKSTLSFITAIFITLLSCIAGGFMLFKKSWPIMVNSSDKEGGSENQWKLMDSKHMGGILWVIAPFFLLISYFSMQVTKSSKHYAALQGAGAAVDIGGGMISSIKNNFFDSN